MPSSTSSTSSATATSTAKSYQAPSSLKVSPFSLTARRPSFTYPVQIVGIVLALVSGVLIGSSFVFKKRGLLRSQAGHTAGEGVAYLKSVRHLLRFPPMQSTTRHNLTGIMVDWHDKFVISSLSTLSGLTAVVMILGELCNFAGA